MKLIIALLFTLTALAGSQSRISSLILSDLKKLNSNHCSQLAVHEESCTKDFNNKMLKKIKSLNSLLINEMFVESRAEEKGKIKYEALLTKESISYPSNSNANQMKEIYNSTMKERNCVKGHTNYLTSVGIEFLPSDTCEILTPIVAEKQCVDSIQEYLTAESVAFLDTDTCSELTVKKEEYLATLEPVI